MAESSTPSGDEQYRIVNELLLEQSNTVTRKQYEYLVSDWWILKWRYHVTHSGKAVYPGKLTMLHNVGCSYFVDLGAMCIRPEPTTNMWVCEPIWSKWVQWYGVNDVHELDRWLPSSRKRAQLEISLKGDVDGHDASKLICVGEKCGYIELQLRRFYGVTHDTETQLWLLGKTTNPLLLDRSKALMHYTPTQVRYDTVFLALTLLQKINVIFLLVFVLILLGLLSWVKPHLKYCLHWTFRTPGTLIYDMTLCLALALVVFLFISNGDFGVKLNVKA